MKNFAGAFTICFIIGIVSFSAGCSVQPGTTTTLDATPPVVTVVSPVNDQIVGRQYQITGTVSDATGVAGVYVRLDGGDWTAAAVNGGNWSATMTAEADGLHTNYVYAKDTLENQSGTIQVIVDRDSVPSVIIDSPDNGTYIICMSVSVSGTAEIETPYNVTNVFINVNGEGWSSISGTDSWSNALALDEYTNTVVVRAYADNGSFADSAVWTIYCEYPFGTAVFVAADGDDANGGLTPDTPVQTIFKGVNLADAYGIPNVLISGDYNLLPGGDNAGITITNKSYLTLTGGWNSAFTSIGAPSVLDGQNLCCPVIFMNEFNNSVFTNFIITGGYALNRFGGGLTIGNSADNKYYCTVSNNTALAGGGIFAYDCDRNIFGGLIAGNTSMASGGGLYIENSADILISAAIAGNSAHTNGGGICISDSENFTINCVVSNNTARNGGGIYSIYAHRNNISGTYSKNTAVLGGGGMFMDTCNSNVITAYILKNTTASDGGGIKIVASLYIIINSTIVSNSAYYGGGLMAQGLDYSQISGLFLGNSASSGGGTYIESSHNASNSGYYYNNIATNGGGLYMYASVSNTVSGGYYNNRGSYGGGIESVNSRFITLSSLVSNNRAVNSGGGYYNSTSRNINIGGTFSDNSANNGGGIYCYSPSNIIVSGTFIRNKANYYGGGFYMSNSKDAIIDGTLDANSSGYDGGGGYFGYSIDIEFSGNIINNISGGNGGGLAMSYSTNVAFEDSAVLQDNHCALSNTGYYGGGAYMNHIINATYTPTTITNPNYHGSGTGTIDNIRVE